mgnify:FL=1
MSVLRHYNWEHEIIFDDGSINHLIIENPITMRNYVLELKSQIEGESGSFILSKNNEEVSLSKNMALITDLVNIKFDEKKINAKINKDIAQLILRNPEMEKTKFNLISLLEEYASWIVDKYDYNIDYLEPDEQGIIKLLNFHINKEYASLPSKLLEWINLSHDIIGIENFIVLNSAIYLSREEEEILSREATAMKHNILFIDASNKNNHTNAIVIDVDNCEIFKTSIR